VAIYVYTCSELEQISEESIVAYFGMLTVCLLKKSEMGGARGTYGRRKSLVRGFDGEIWRNHVEDRRKLKDNINP